MGSEQANAPGRRGPRPGAAGLAAYALRLTPFQLRLGPRLVLRWIAFRLDARLALGGRGLAPRLGAGGSWSWCGWWCGDRRLGTTDGWLPPLGPFGRVSTIRLRRTRPWLGLGRRIRPARTLAGTVPVLVTRVVALIADDGPRPRLHGGRCNDARAAQITTAAPDLVPLIVVGGTRAHARDERFGCLTVLEDEARLGPERPGERHPRRTVGAIGVIVRIVEHHDPKARAGVVVRAPGGIVHVRVAVVAQEPGIVVVPLDVVGCEVVVPVAVPRRHDTLRQVRDCHVGIAVHAAVADRAIVPMVMILERIVHEGVARDDGEDVAHAGGVVDVKGVARVAARYFVVAVAAREVVLPRLAREQHAHPAVGVDAQDGDVGVLLGAKVHAHALAAGVGVVAPVGPDFDARAGRHRGGLVRGARDGADEQAEQAERGQHKCLPLRERSRRRAMRRADLPAPNRLSIPTLRPRSRRGARSRLSSTRDNRPIISFRHPHG